MTNSHDFLFVIGFALIPFLKISETTQENTYLQVLHSYLERKFKFDNSLPMPYLLDYYFYELMTYLNYKDSLKLIILQGIRIVYHILLVYFIFYLLDHKQKTLKTGLNLLNKSLIPIIFCKSMTELSGRLNNTSSLFYSILSIYFYLKTNLFVSSLFLGLAITTNWASLGVLFILLGCIGFKFYDDIIDRNKNVIKTCFNSLRKILIMILIPILIYFISFLLSYKVRYQYDPSMSKFSLEFQSTFYNEDLEKCHKILVNNSIVTFINKRYKWYLSAEKKEDEFSVFGSKTLDENCLWIIKKASGDKGYILPGEKIRIIHFSYEKALSLNKVDSKEKFFSLELTDEELVKESENELFKFEIVKNFTNLIETRNTIFKLVNTNTSMDLCMKRIKKSDMNTGSAEMSLYANLKNIEFYIADNQIPEESDEDENLIDQELINYPKLTIFKKFIEHQASLFKYRHTKRALNKNWTFVDRINIAILCLIPLFLLINYVFIHRYEKGFFIGHDFIFLYTLYLFTRFFSYFLMDDELLKNVVDTALITTFLKMIGKKVSIGYNGIIILNFFID